MAARQPRTRAARRERRAPLRTCAGCGRRAPQPELVRFAAVDGVLTPGRTLPGRGAYTCCSLACFEQALSRRAFRRTLRSDVTASTELTRIYTGESDG